MLQLGLRMWALFFVCQESELWAAGYHLPLLPPSCPLGAWTSCTYHPSLPPLPHLFSFPLLRIPPFSSSCTTSSSSFICLLLSPLLSPLPPLLPSSASFLHFLHRLLLFHVFHSFFFFFFVIYWCSECRYTDTGIHTSPAMDG